MLRLWTYPQKYLDILWACGSCCSTRHILSDHLKCAHFISTLVLQNKRMCCVASWRKSFIFSIIKPLTKCTYLSSNITAVSPEAKSCLINSSIMSAAVNGAYAWTLIVCTFPFSLFASAASIETDYSIKLQIIKGHVVFAHYLGVLW